MTKLTVDRLYWSALLACGVIGAGLGFYGWIGVLAETHGTLLFADYLYAGFLTIQMFPGENTAIGIPRGNYPLLISAVISPVTTFGALLRIVLELFATRIERWRTRALRGHTVICGLTSHGLAFALSEIAARRRVAAIDARPSESHEAMRDIYGMSLVQGEPGDRATLEAAAVGNAARIIIATGNDSTNLEAATLARTLAQTRQAPLLANVLINDHELWRRAAQSDAIERRHPGFELRPFNLAVAAARQFFWDEPLYTYADLRGQRRIHAVFVGYDEYVECLIAQLVPCCVYKDFDKALLTVLSGDPTRDAARFRVRFPAISANVDLRFQPFDPETDLIGEQFMAGVEDAAPVTGVFVCQSSDDAGLRTALQVHDAMQRHRRWKAPTYVRMTHCDGVRDLLVSPAKARRFSQIVQAFGMEDQLCNIGFLEGRLETIARDLHEAYRRSRELRMSGDGDTQRLQSLSEWKALPETYRQANRRAADHTKAKLASAGSWLPAGADFYAAPEYHLFDSPTELEALSALEHRSWCAGLAIDGWQSGDSRSNARKIHDQLGKTYEELDEATKEYDRDQIRLIDESILQRGTDSPAIRHDHWIGLIGRNAISAADATWMRQQLVEQILPKLVQRHRGAMFTLLTPLAPGSDYVLTVAALDFLRKAGLPHRLLVVEGAPESAVLADYRAHYDAGASWDGEERPSGQRWTDPQNPRAGAGVLIAEAREKLIAGLSTDWVIDLTWSDADYEKQDARQGGYQAAGNYLATRCATLVASHGADNIVKPGGVVETLQNRAAFEREKDSAGSRPRQHQRSTLILNLSDRSLRSPSESPEARPHQ